MSQNVFLLNHVICDYSALLIHRRKLTRQLKWCCSSLCTSVLYPPAGKNYSVRIGLLCCHRKKTTGSARWLQNALAFSLRCCDVVIANNNYREVVCAPLPTKQRKTTENGVILPPLLSEEKDCCDWEHDDFKMRWTSLCCDCKHLSGRSRRWYMTYCRCVEFF